MHRLRVTTQLPAVFYWQRRVRAYVHFSHLSGISSRVARRFRIRAVKT